MNLIDTHAHLSDDKYINSLDLIINKANQAGVSYIINCGYDLKSSIKGIEISEKYSCVYASVGVHPHDSKHYDKSCEDKLSDICNNKKVIAIGEIGLDFHYDFSPRELQFSAFEAQLELAAKLELPVIIHSRESNTEVIDVLYKWKDKLIGGVLHCFSGDTDDLKKVLDLGFYIGIDGPITFKKNQELAEVVKQCPLDKILLETDCPYLAPVPYRGKLNEPAHLIHIANKIAEIKCLREEDICQATTKNAYNLFKIKT